MEHKSVVIVGLGYIGLPTAAIAASAGLRVYGVDVSQRVVDTVNRGMIHIIEPDLAGLVSKVVTGGMLSASTRPREADVFVIAVPTPFRENHDPDISYVEAATDSVIPFLRPGNLFVLESTSPVGTTERIASRIFGLRPDLHGRLHVAYCPERVLPGNVIQELVHNERSIGGVDEESAKKAVEFYAKFVKAKLNTTDARTAEMCKLVENAYRDVNIAFANELSILCDGFGIDVWKLIELANRHPRVEILRPGCGVGGHCIAVDPWFLVAAAPADAKVIRAARERNDHKERWTLEKIEKAADEFQASAGRAPVIACMGLAFKPNIDDLRESPALEIARLLKDHGRHLLVVEPNIQTHPDFELHGAEEAVRQADIVVFLTGHQEFAELRLPGGKIAMDFCGITRD